MKFKPIILFICMLTCWYVQVQAQTMQVTGSVKDSIGNPIHGVTIKLKNGTTTVATGENGQFSIAAPLNGVLVFKHTAFQSKEVAVVSDNMTIVLQPLEKDLNEVVIVGYSQTKKINLTGAVSSVSSKDLQNRPLTNIGQVLQGQVANLNITQSSGGAPNARPNINVRGYTGFGISTGPLVVIDGVPRGDINSINALI